MTCWTEYLSFDRNTVNAVVTAAIRRWNRFAENFQVTVIRTGADLEYRLAHWGARPRPVSGTYRHHADSHDTARRRTVAPSVGRIHSRGVVCHQGAGARNTPSAD